MKRISLAPDISYTFSDYFKLEATTEEVLEYFAVTLAVGAVPLPQSSVNLDRLDNLLARLEENFSAVSLTSEIARREFLIAPVIAEVAHYAKARVRVEYAVNLNLKLKGTIDYFLRSHNSLLIVEAKNADLTKGFTQMATELLALDLLLEEDEAALVYGAVSTGDIWRFGVLDRARRHITQDINSFRVPQDVAGLLRSLIGILE